MISKNSSNAKSQQNKIMNSSTLKKNRCEKTKNKNSSMKKKNKIHAMNFQVRMILKHTGLCLSFLIEIGADVLTLMTWQLFLSNSIKIHLKVGDSD